MSSSTPRSSAALVQVTTYDALLADNSRITWQSFRRADDPPGSNPVVYFITLAANPGLSGATVIDLSEVGAQAANHEVAMILLDGTASWLPAGQDPVPLQPGVPVMLPAQGADGPAKLSFLNETCSLKFLPKWSEAVQSLRGDSDPATPPPPPPFPGGDGNR